MKAAQPTTPARPPMLPGFEHIRRYWDPARGIYAAKLLPGEFYVTRSRELLVTVLGSCVSACVWDANANIGGMNHFMLPDASDAVAGLVDGFDESARYGCFAMEHLVNALLSYGAVRERLRVKLAGGAQMHAHHAQVGERNVRFVRDYLRIENMSLVGEHVCGHLPRKVVFDPLSGAAQVKSLRRLHNDTIAQRESSYRHTLESGPVNTDIELFGES
ncbi:MAG: chemoreceptor glutamine deamidase CheD [Gammaproteobacteria bacterium]|nr:chemoreceptor glutamine deamidase CheD [Gammaproteobacteria bacterium]